MIFPGPLPSGWPGVKRNGQADMTQMMFLDRQSSFATVDYHVVIPMRGVGRVRALHRTPPRCGAPSLTRMGARYDDL